MQKLVRLVVWAVGVSLAASGCQSTHPNVDTPVKVIIKPNTPPGMAEPGQLQQPGTPTPPVSAQDPAPTQIGQTTPPTQPDPATPNTGGLPPPTPPAQAKYPFGKQVADKPGYCTSPYAPLNGLVDIRDPAGKPYPRQTLVKCPYTGKLFYVP